MKSMSVSILLTDNWHAVWHLTNMKRGGGQDGTNRTASYTHFSKYMMQTVSLVTKIVINYIQFPIFYNLSYHVLNTKLYSLLQRSTDKKTVL